MISLSEMAALTRMMTEAEMEMKNSEDIFKRCKERFRELREETIPAAMAELGLESLTLETGEKITVKDDVYASIPKDRRSEAYEWLEQNGFGGLLKVDVKIPFTKGEIEEARALARQLHGSGHSCLVDEGIHPQTLKAFLREQIAAGANVPLDLFGARPVTVAKIK